MTAIKDSNLSDVNPEPPKPFGQKGFAWIKLLIVISLILSAIFIALSYLTRELRFYLLAGSSFLTFVTAIISFPRANKTINKSLVFLCTLFLEITIALLAGVFPAYYGIPYAVIAITLTFLISNSIPRGGISDWIITIGIISGIASLQLTLLASLPQFISPNIAIVVTVTSALLLIIFILMLIQRRITTTIRTKLLLSSLAMTLAPLLILSLVSTRILQNSIQEQSNQSLKVAADQTALSIDNFITTNSDSIVNEASLPSIVRYLNLAPTERVLSPEETELKTTFQSLQTKEKVYLPSYGLLDLTGTNLYDTVSANIGESEQNTSYFQATSISGSVHVSDVEYLPGSNNTYVYFISPVKSETAQIIGYLRVRYDARILQSLLKNNVGLLGMRSYPILLDENGLRLADGFSPNSVHHLIAPLTRQEYDVLLSQNRLPSYLTYEESVIPQADLAAALKDPSEDRYYTALLDVQSEKIAHSGTMVDLTSKSWTVAYLQDQSGLTAALSDQTRSSILISSILAIVIGILVTLIAGAFSNPIIQLTQAAEKIAAGDLSVQANVTSNDEIGTLGNSFNSMTRQLKDLVSTLENRVRERTKQLAQQNESLQFRSRQLQTVADVARSIVSTREVDSLLDLVTNLVSDRFGFYHVGIFLLDDSGEYAVLRAANSPGGKNMLDRQHKLRVGQVGIVGYVTGTGEPRIATDVGEDAVFFNNPDLPQTRSEMALPLKLGNLIIGALDVQSVEPDAFSEDDIALFTTLADQISVAIENANAYEISQQTVEEMKELDRVKSQFLANMSHELRTPLNSVIGFSRVILKGIDGPINETQEQDITAIYNSGMHLLNMINEILDLSKIEAGKMELQVDEISILDVINSAIVSATGLIKDKPIELVSKVESDLPLVKADEIRINQVITNLIANAVKFTEKGTITVEASLRHNDPDKDEIMISVADTGIGIADEDRDKLFQRFSQVDDSPTRRTGGTGLGLSICRSLVEMHGGTIGLLDSEVDKGSVFYFTLPVPEQQEPQAMDYSLQSDNIILSIDDDAQVITLYERFLKPYGYDVVPLTDPTIAVERARELKPFAITLDIMMPDKDGWQVLSDLKKDEETRDIPVMICSILEEEEKGFSLGASEYLVKPFLHDDLANAIKRLNRNGDVHDVLIIDDDPQYLRLLQKMIEDEGQYLPVLADGGVSALKLLNDFTPDVIIMDLMLEDISGFDLVEKFNSEPRLKQVPVILITGSELDDNQLESLGNYRDQILSKWTMNKSDLLQNLQETLSRLRPTRLVT